MATSTPKVVLYTRRDCHLCDEAKRALERLGRRVAFQLDERDVDTDEGWAAAFGEEVPVGFVDGRKLFKYHVDPAKVRRALEVRRG